MRRAERELSEFISLLKNSEDRGVASIIAIATHQRHAFASSLGWDLLKPASIWAERRDCSLLMAKTYDQRRKKDNNPLLGLDVAVWMHTLRATAPEASSALRALGREMWRELERGFAALPKAATKLARMVGGELNVDGARTIPVGLSV